MERRISAGNVPDRKRYTACRGDPKYCGRKKLKRIFPFECVEFRPKIFGIMESTLYVIVPVS